jgi:putative ABC transport system permease protein
MIRPPRLARLLISASLPNPDREFVLGDLEEQFARRAASDGSRRAVRHYWTQALGIAWHARAIRHRLPSAPARRRVEMWHLSADVRLGLRTIARSPSYSLVAIVTVALAIGANTLLFSIANPFVLRPLPIKHPDRLGWIWQVNGLRGVDRGRASMADFLEWRKSAQSFTALAAFEGGSATLTGHGDAERVQTLRSTSNLISVWGLTPARGRLFLPGEDLPGRPLVGILSYRYWRERFQADPAVINRTLFLDGTPLTIVGVMKPEIELGTLSRIDIWTPLPLDGAPPRDQRTLKVAGILAPGATLASAGVELHGLAKAQATANPLTNEGWDVRVVSTKAALASAETWVILGLLSVVVGFVLLIACANLANLMLARVVGKSQDLAVRLALGASRLQLVRPLVVESVLLGVIGGGIGLAIAGAGLRLVTATTYDAFLKSTTIDQNVLLFNAALSLLTPILFSLWPVLTAGRAATAETLRDARTSGGRTASGRRNVLVASQVALALALLIVSTLVVQSGFNFARLDLGLDVDHALTFSYELPRGRYPDDASRARFARDVASTFATLPNTTGAGLISHLPVFDAEVTHAISGTDHDGARDQDKPWASWFAASPGFFRAAGIALVAGRAFEAADRPGAQPVAVLGRTAAERYFDEIEKAIGRTIVISGHGLTDRPVTIVGVVADTRDATVSRTSPQVYVPFDQWPMAAMTVLLRSDEPVAHAPDARAAMRRLDPALGISIPKSLRTRADEDRSSNRVVFGLFTSFALLALALAASGLYGVISYSVGQRRREIGVRIALGATPAAIRRMVVMEGLRVTGFGIAVGLVGGALLARASSSILYGVNPIDPLTFVGLTGVVLIVAVGAVWSPAARAMRVDPVRSLRAD